MTTICKMITAQLLDSESKVVVSLSKSNFVNHKIGKQGIDCRCALSCTRLDAEEEYTLYYDAQRRIEATRQLKHWSSAVGRSIKLGTVTVIRSFSLSAVHSSSGFDYKWREEDHRGHRQHHDEGICRRVLPVVASCGEKRSEMMMMMAMVVCR